MMATTAKRIDTAAASQTMECSKGPLKGKGQFVRQWSDEAQARLKAIQSAMNGLKAETKQIQAADNSWALDIYSITSRGATSLRWRMKGGSHVTWEKLEPRLQHLPPALAQWYREANIRAELLNTQEQVARYELKAIKRFVSSTEDSK